MQKVKVTSITKSDFRNILKMLTRDYTFAYGLGELERGISLMYPSDELRGVPIPGVQPKDGNHMYIDYPMRYPICVDIAIPCDSVHELSYQVRSVLMNVLENRKEFYVSKYVNMEDLYLYKFTTCTNGDIIVYVES